MSVAAPDSETVDAWLRGELSPEAAAAVDAYFEKHPEAISDGGSDPELLTEIDGAVEDEALAALVDRIKTRPGVNLVVEDDAPPWEEILEPSDDPGLIGMLGAYEVSGLIAAGGMGIVLKACDPKLERTIAIKVLSSQLANNASARGRFLREARAAAKLEHENILSIFAIHDEGTVPYFTMRYVDGGTLEDRLAGGERVGFEELKPIARQVASALAVAHEKGIIHRDIKPANILLGEGGEQLWVCDFGIARSTEDPSLAYAGSVAGTPQYMSPEQAAGEELDGRSDLFSLGAVLHRCATGQHAFVGDTSAAVLKQVANQETKTIVQADAKFPEWFVRLLANMLAKDPRDRPQDAAAVVAAIDDEHVPRPKHSARRNRRLAIAAAAVVILAGVAFALLQNPKVVRSVNHILARSDEQTFTLEGRLGTYANLAEATAAARNGDTILLPVGEPILVDVLRLPDKSLIFRSAEPDLRPTMTTSIEGTPGIIATAPLRLEGIDFLLNPKNDNDGIIMLQSTSVHMEDCSFTSDYNTKAVGLDFRPRVVEIHGTASAVIDGCRFDLAGCNAISLSDTQAGDGDPTLIEIRIRDSEIDAYYGIAIHELRSSEAKIEVEVDGLAFNGRRFLKRSAIGDLPKIRCEVERSKFDLVLDLCWLPVRDERVLREQFVWNGRNNEYVNGRAHVRMTTSSSNNPLVSAVNFYSTPSAMMRSLMSKDDGEILVEETGERFYSLAAAIEEAPDGANLILSGRFVPTSEIIAPGKKRFHLRSAPGKPASIIGVIDAYHAIFLRGGGSVKGIHFVREKATGASMPVIGIRPADAPLVVEDCLFETKPVGEEAGCPFVITDAMDAIVRRCVLRNPRGAAFGAYFASSENSSVKLEDCLLSGRGSIQLYSKIKNTTLHLSAARCAFYTDYLVGHRKGALSTVSFDFVDNVIDSTGPFFSLPSTPARVLGEKLDWHGRGNHYREGAPFSMSADGLQAEPASWFDEENANFGTPFDRPMLDGTPRVEELIDALDPAAPSSVRDALTELPFD